MLKAAFKHQRRPFLNNAELREVFCGRPPGLGAEDVENKLSTDSESCRSQLRDFNTRCKMEPCYVLVCCQSLHDIGDFKAIVAEPQRPAMSQASPPIRETGMCA